MTDLLALLAAYGSASCTPSAGGRAGTEPNECTADAREQCKAFPCIDLREADNHHHPMWLNSPGNAGVMYYREDGSGAAGRDWTCTCSDCNGLVGVWSCPGFYGTTITVTADYADDFTPTRNNDFIDVCQPQKAADCDVSSLDGMTAQASSGRAINVIKGVPLVGDL